MPALSMLTCTQVDSDLYLQQYTNPRFADPLTPLRSLGRLDDDQLAQAHRMCGADILA